MDVHGEEGGRGVMASLASRRLRSSRIELARLLDADWDWRAAGGKGGELADASRTGRRAALR